MKLTKKSETTSKITFTYDRPPGAVEGYLYYAGGQRVSRTFNPADLEVTFGKVPSGQYAVEAVGFDVVARAEWPESPTDYPLPPIPPLRIESGDHFYRDGDGLLTEKLHVPEAPSFAIANMRWNGSLPPAQQCPPPSTGIWVLRDCKAQNTKSNGLGTDGSGFWIGEKTQGERLEAWANEWMNMVTLANCAGSRFTDVDLHDNPHVGLYMEHVSTDVEYRRSNFGGPRLGVQPDSSSINVEWAYESAVYGPRLPFGGKAGSYSCRFIDSDIFCPKYIGVGKDYEVRGAFLDAGTFDFLFLRCRFWGPGAALGFPKKRLNMDPAKDNKAIDCIFEQDGPDVTYHDNLIG